MEIVEYSVTVLISIRKCPKCDSLGLGNKPPYWYIKKPLYTCDIKCGLTSEQLKKLKDDHFDVLYWNGDRWWYHTPKQFANPEEAFAEYQEKIEGKRWAD